MDGERYSFRWQWISVSAEEGICVSRPQWGVFSECAMTSGERGNGRRGRKRSKFGQEKSPWRLLDLSQRWQQVTCARLPCVDKTTETVVSKCYSVSTRKQTSSRKAERSLREKKAFCPGGQCAQHKLPNQLCFLGKVVFNLAQPSVCTHFHAGICYHPIPFAGTATSQPST